MSLGPLSLLADYPLVWLVSPGAAPQATLTPVVAETTPSGYVLRGHLPRRHPHVEILAREPAATILALGPNAYVSPSWLGDRTQAPTWNYAALKIDVTVRLAPGAAETEAVLREQIHRYEASGAAPWSESAMGPRFQSLAQGVIAFEAEPTATDARMKLGQGDRDDVFGQSLTALEGHPIHAWMVEYNPGRRP